MTPSLLGKIGNLAYGTEAPNYRNARTLQFCQLSCPSATSHNTSFATFGPIMDLTDRKGNLIAGLTFRTEFPTFQDVHPARFVALLAKSPENPELATGHSTSAFASSKISVQSITCRTRRCSSESGWPETEELRCWNHRMMRSEGKAVAPSEIPLSRPFVLLRTRSPLLSRLGRASSIFGSHRR